MHLRCNCLSISLMVSGAALALGATPALSQTADQDETEAVDTAQGNTIVVTATRTGTELENLPLSVSVVEEEELRQQISQNRSILNALEFTVPGLNITRSEAEGSCGTQLRGRAVSFQLNGVPVDEQLRNSSCSGPFRVSPFAIQSVEAIRGGTALYGAGAPGGIINFQTRRASSADLEVDFVAQTSFNTEGFNGTFATDLYAGVGQNLGDFDYYVGLSYSDLGFIRSGNNNLAFFDPSTELGAVTSLGYRFGDSEVRFTGTYSKRDFDETTYPDGTLIRPGVGNVRVVTSHPFRDQADDENITLITSFEDDELLAHQVNISLFYQQQRRRQRDNFFSDAGGDFFFATDREEDRIGFRSTLIRSYDIGQAELKTSYGLDYLYNDTYRPTIDPGMNDAVVGFIAPPLFLNTYSVFGQAELDINRLTLTGGVRQEWYTGGVTDRDFDPALPRVATPGDFANSDLALFNLGAVYDVTDDIQLYAGFSQGAELSALGRAARGTATPGAISNQPATNDQYEIGVRGGSGPVRFELVGYYTESESSAQFQQDPTCTPEELASICPLIPLRVPERTYGAEASVNWAVTDQLDLGGIFTLQRGEIQDPASGEFINFSTERAVPLRLTGRADYRPIEELSLGVQVNHVGSSSFFTPTQEAIGLIDTDAVTLVAANVGYDFGQYNIYLAADNLLDEVYVNPSSQAQNFPFFQYEAPGRRITVGVRGRF